MTEIRFYHLQRTTLEAALPSMLDKTLARGQRAVLMAGSPERVEALAAWLWTYDERGFLPTIPNDPLWAATGKQYRYVSHDGQAYGLWIHLEYAQGDLPAGSSCMTGVGHAGTGWYAGASEFNGRQPPECPF